MLMVRRRVRAPFLTLLIAAWFAAAGAWAEGTPVSSLSEGKPALMGSALDPGIYVEVPTRKLAHARLHWVNLKLLRELGIEVPVSETGVPAEFARKVLDAFAYAVPTPADPPGTFVAEGGEKLFYADRYGGSGVGRNLGSGRAASAGKVQIKGIGPTALVRSRDPAHSDGAMGITEAWNEAIYSEVLHEDLPYGANRVVAVIETGRGGAMVVRQDPVRPAHFVPNFNDESLEGKLGPVLQGHKLLDALPRPAVEAEGAAPTVLLRGRIDEYVDRLARQYAAAYARRFYHGATSPSNFSLNGEFLDFGTMNAQRGYSQIRVLKNNDPSGKTREIKKLLVADFLEALRPSVPHPLMAGVPRTQDAIARFDLAYSHALDVEFLQLAGAPPALAEPMARLASGKKLAGELQALVKVGNDRVVSLNDEGLVDTGKYDLEKVLSSLAEGKGYPDLAESYRDFIAALERAGVARSEVVARAARLNRKTPSLYRAERFKEIEALGAQIAEGGDLTQVQNYIDGRIRDGERFFREPSVEVHASAAEPASCARAPLNALLPAQP
jgi:hypothetical protein